MGLKREKNVRKTGKLWKIYMEKTWENHGKTMDIYIYIWKKIRTCGKTMENNMEKVWKNYRKIWENYGT